MVEQLSHMGHVVSGFFLEELVFVFLFFYFQIENRMGKTQSEHLFCIQSAAAEQFIFSTRLRRIQEILKIGMITTIHFQAIFFITSALSLLRTQNLLLNFRFIIFK